MLTYKTLKRMEEEARATNKEDVMKQFRDNYGDLTSPKEVKLTQIGFVCQLIDSNIGFNPDIHFTIPNLKTFSAKYGLSA
jgi:hypothetical protein